MRRAAWQRLLAADPPPWVRDHCRAVEGLAMAMCRRASALMVPVDEGRVCAGALLHDIGRSVTQDVRHASIGADMLRADGWDDTVVLIVERHTGAGIEASEAARLGLPPRDYVPRTLEQKIVAHADNLHSGDRRLTLAQLERKYLDKGLDHAWARIRNLHEELCRTLGTDLERLEPVRMPPLEAPA